MRRAPADSLRALAEMPIAGSPPRLSTHPDRFLAVLHPPSRSALTSNPHSARCPAGPNFPRLRALALFGRLSAQRAQTLVIAGVQKPAHFRRCRSFPENSGVARKFHEFLPGSELFLIPGARHFVQLDEPEQVARLILAMPGRGSTPA